MSSRAERARERQRSYQRDRAARGEVLDDSLFDVAALAEQMHAMDRLLDGRLAQGGRVLEVGCGASGHIFFLAMERARCVGVDPLAREYDRLYLWQRRTPRLAARGEALPFGEGTFDVVFCDNVVDHAAEPHAILVEIARVLKVGGRLFFAVNVHHPFYGVLSDLYGALWAAGVVGPSGLLARLGLPSEVRPFADHTVHLDEPAALALLEGGPWTVCSRHREPAPTRLAALIGKNARLEIVAERAPITSA